MSIWVTQFFPIFPIFHLFPIFSTQFNSIVDLSDSILSFPFIFQDKSTRKSNCTIFHLQKSNIHILKLRKKFFNFSTVLPIYHWNEYSIFYFASLSFERLAVRERYIGVDDQAVAKCGENIRTRESLLLIADARSRDAVLSFFLPLFKRDAALSIVFLLDLENVPRLSYLPIVPPFPFSKISETFVEIVLSAATPACLYRSMLTCWIFTRWNFFHKSNEKRRISNEQFYSHVI